MAGQELQLTQGLELKFFYQVWTSSPSGTSRTGKKLEVDYVYGRMGALDTKTLHDEIPLEQLDAGGSVLNGKRIPTVDLAPGNYRLVMTLRDPETQAKAYGSLTFGVFSKTSAMPAWDISDEGLSDSIKTGTADFQRASCYLALGDRGHSMEWFQKAYAKNPSSERFSSKLVELYFGRQEYARVTEVYAKSGISESTDEQTIARIAASLDKTGNTRKAVEIMESGTHLKPSSGPLLLGLAEYYRKTGDLQRAGAAEQKGKQLMAAHPES
jgi:tetratricopeptide (TPR) repeat protein